jgi:flagellar biosynthesis/type III secretory pathway chaperone
MEDQNKMELKLKLDLLSNLWREFCEKHTELYELTCDEYMHLLDSDIDKLDSSVEEKRLLLVSINELESHRQDITNEVSSLLKIEQPKKLAVLLDELRKNDEENFSNQIEKLNLILLDIVTKIQDQNRKNQVFLNKAILSLNDLKRSFTGKNNYKTYSSSGLTKSTNTF